MTDGTVYDVIVVGAGVQGSATAYQLSKRGVKVLQLEQFPLNHSKGSSHGQTRLTRKVYPERFYTDIMHESTRQWESLQKEVGHTIFDKTGFMVIGPMNGDYLTKNIASLEESNADYTVIPPDVFQKKYYPDLLKYSGDWGGVFDPEGGILMADRAVNAFQTLFVKNGGTLHDGEPVTRIEPGAIVHVITPRNKYSAKALVLCCGPWTNKILRGLKVALPLEPVQMSVCFWPEKVPGTYTRDRFPPCSEPNTSDGYPVYAIPAFEHPGHVKLVMHHHGPAIDPDRLQDENTRATIDLLKDYVKEHFPGLKSKPSFVESCLYTNTPDKDFILDRHPTHQNIIIGAGFSGHGFKMAPIIGSILADLATQRDPRYDWSHFRLDRFEYSHQFYANL